MQPTAEALYRALLDSPKPGQTPYYIVHERNIDATTMYDDVAALREAGHNVTVSAGERDRFIQLVP